jgi:CBS domain-containing protein
MTTKLRPEQGSFLAASFERATVADVMCAGVITCPPDAAAVEVARIMASRHVHAVVVAGLHASHGMGEELRWRVVTDTDLLRAAPGIDGLTANDLGGATPVSLAPSTALADAADIMVQYGLTHVIVADAGRPVGVVSTLDVAGALAWGRA